MLQDLTKEYKNIMLLCRRYVETSKQDADKIVSAANSNLETLEKQLDSAQKDFDKIVRSQEMLNAALTTVKKKTETRLMVYLLIWRNYMVNVSKLAMQFDYQVVGDETIEICGINWAERAKPQEIAVAYAPDDILKTDAVVILTEPCFVDTNKTLIFCDDFVEIAMIKIAEYFVEIGVLENHKKASNDYISLMVV